MLFQDDPILIPAVHTMSSLLAEVTPEQKLLRPPLAPEQEQLWSLPPYRT